MGRPVAQLRFEAEQGGSKSFIIRYRNEHGRRRMLTIGRFGRVTLQQARARAMQKFAEVDEGGDPVGERRRASADTLDKHCDNPYLHNYYLLLLLTGARRNELLEAKWEHVDLERGELFLPDTKNGTDHTVPLSAPAVQLFDELPRQQDNPWVFCGQREGQRLREVNRPWRDYRKKADLPDVVLHDFRRTAASWLAQFGYSELIIKRFLNHTVDGVTGMYARLRPEAVRGAVEEYGRRVMAAVRGESADDNVIPLATAKGDG